MFDVLPPSPSVVEVRVWTVQGEGPITSVGRRAGYRWGYGYEFLVACPTMGVDVLALDLSSGLWSSSFASDVGQSIRVGEYTLVGDWIVQVTGCWYEWDDAVAVGYWTAAGFGVAVIWYVGAVGAALVSAPFRAVRVGLAQEVS